MKIKLNPFHVTAINNAKTSRQKCTSIITKVTNYNDGRRWVKGKVQEASGRGTVGVNCSLPTPNDTMINFTNTTVTQQCFPGKI